MKVNIWILIFLVILTCCSSCVKIYLEGPPVKEHRLCGEYQWIENDSLSFGLILRNDSTYLCTTVKKDSVINSECGKWTYRIAKKQADRNLILTKSEKGAHGLFYANRFWGKVIVARNPAPGRSPNWFEKVK